MNPTKRFVFIIANLHYTIGPFLHDPQIWDWIMDNLEWDSGAQREQSRGRFLVAFSVLSQFVSSINVNT